MRLWLGDMVLAGSVFWGCWLPISAERFSLCVSCPLELVADDVAFGALAQGLGQRLLHQTSFRLCWWSQRGEGTILMEEVA